MSTAIAEKKLSTRHVEPEDRQRARQSRHHPDCRSTTIKSPVTQIPLALSSPPDNHPPAATAEMAILIVAGFPSRLSRYINRAAVSNHSNGPGKIGRYAARFRATPKLLQLFERHGVTPA